ncbi:TPA: DUF87 domain-containing protein [Bacillus thuringiensis]|nr:DUF87 domain-containing protein [Bacillus thuringiensis]
MKLLTKQRKKRVCELDEFLDASKGFKNKISSARIEEKRDYLEFGDNFARTLLVIDYPNSVKGNWMSRLYRFSGNMNVSTHMRPISSEKMVRYLDKSIQELEARLQESLTPRRKKETERKLESAELMLSSLMNGNQKTIMLVYTYIHLQSRTLEGLEQITKKIQGAIWKTGITVAVARDNMLEAFRSVLPTCEPTLEHYTQQNMHNAAASSLMPFDESELFMDRGVIMGENLHTDSLVLVDMENRKVFPSRNMLVLGSTGMGKSFFMQKNLLRDWYLAGDDTRIFVIDPEREFVKLIKKIGGQVIRISANTQHIINPLQVSPHAELDDEEKEQEKNILYSKIQRLKIFFKMIKPDMSILELALLEKAIFETYSKFKITEETSFENMKNTDFPILSDLFDVIEKGAYTKLDDFKDILRTYVTGSNSKLFNAHTNVDLSNSIICFDIKDLEQDADCQPVLMFNVLSFLWDEITKDRTQRKKLYVDEAHILMRNPKSALFLLDVYKRIRKYLGGAVIASQQPCDFLDAEENGTNYGKAIINNSISMLILGLNGNDIQDLKKHEVLNLSEEEESIISKRRQGEGIYVAGNTRVYMKVDYTAKELELIDPEQYEEKYGKKASA